jgi:hypothetical protein
MAETEPTYLAAVLNSNKDIVEALQLILADAGISSIGTHIVEFRKGRIVTAVKTAGAHVL